MVDVVLGYVTFVPSLLHQNHIEVTSNFRMELVRAKNKALV
jgi:hypothetical protein